MFINKRVFKSEVILLITSLLFFNCTIAQNRIKNGNWRGVLQLNDSTILPINFEVNENYLDVVNATEKITVDEISYKNDSVFIKMPVFDSEFRCRNYGDSLKGVWVNHSRKEKNIIPFSAYYRVSDRFIIKTWTNYEPISQGNWEVTFDPKAKDSEKALGIFIQSNVKEGSKLTGTFATESGDYRYLQGVQANEYLYLSCFDGTHAFLFTAKLKGDSLINGHFYSGAHGHETWVAKRNDKFQLRNPDSLTFLKAGYDKIDFSFKNLEGKQVSLSDEKYKNKVVVIQLMGTWCPNCMDETKFLSSFYKTYQPKGLEIIGLAFERTDDFSKAVANINRLKMRFNANYDFLITMKTGAQQASEALPMLNKVMAFPTTIYIDKKGKVRKIYTGYYGPATGSTYTKQIEETTSFVEKLLAE